MKKILFATAFIFMSFTTFSQVKVRPGFRAGLNFSKITHTENASRKTGANAAMFVNIHLSRFYELQPELTYSNQGWSYDGHSYITPYDSTVNIESHDVSSHYIGMSMTNKFYMSPKMGLHILLGPGFEINISDDYRNDSLTPVDMVFFAGLGYEFPFGLGLEARYKQGIIDVDTSYYDYYENGYYDDNYYNGKNKLNSVFQFNVYYKFAW